jgi:hypothetical protein
MIMVFLDFNYIFSFHTKSTEFHQVQIATYTRPSKINWFQIFRDCECLSTDTVQEVSYVLAYSVSKKTSNGVFEIQERKGCSEEA